MSLACHPLLPLLAHVKIAPIAYLYCLPLSYLLHHTDLLKECICVDPSISASIFIDDTMLLAATESIEDNCKILAMVYKACEHWAQTYGSKFASDKYKLVHITRQHKVNKARPVTLYSTSILEPVNEAKFLEMIIDSKLD